MHSIFNHLDLNKLRYIGAGGNVIVLTDNKYVVKLGTIRLDEVNALMLAYEYKLAPRIIDLQYDTITIGDIPERIKSILKPGFYVEKQFMMLTKYFRNRNTISVMIMEYAKPLLRTSYDYKEDSRIVKRASTIATRLGEAYYAATNYNFMWVDCHAWNVGILNGRYVILDM
jgi:hypothetical protein